MVVIFWQWQSTRLDATSQAADSAASWHLAVMASIPIAQLHIAVMASADIP